MWICCYIDCLSAFKNSRIMLPAVRQYLLTADYSGLNAYIKVRDFVFWKLSIKLLESQFPPMFTSSILNLHDVRIFVNNLCSLNLITGFI